MRLLAVIPEYPPVYSGGIATYYKVLFPALAKLGVETKILVPPCNGVAPIEEIDDERISVENIDDDRIKRIQNQLHGLSVCTGITRLLATGWAAYEQTDRGKGFDLVECTDWGFFYVPWLLAPSRLPVVVRLHGSNGQIAFHDGAEQSPIDGTLNQLIEASLLPRADILTTYSTANQRFWSDQLSRDIDYVPPPLSLSSVDISCQKKDETGLVVGRVQLWKGAKTLCSALEVLGNEAPLVNWIGRSVFSRKSNLAYDKELSVSHPHVWGSRVKQLPQMLPLEIRKKQISAKFVLVPSDWDVFNFTAVEAMAQQAVVICSSGAGASDLIQHGKNGFLFRAKDPVMLADVIRQVQGMSEQEMKSIGLAARSTVESFLSPDRVASLTLEQYRKALGKEPRKLPESDLISPNLSPVVWQGSASTPVDLCLESIDLKFLTRHVMSRIAKKLHARLIP